MLPAVTQDLVVRKPAGHMADAGADLAVLGVGFCFALEQGAAGALVVRDDRAAVEVDTVTPWQ